MTVDWELGGICALVDIGAVWLFIIFSMGLYTCDGMNSTCPVSAAIEWHHLGQLQGGGRIFWSLVGIFRSVGKWD